MKIAEKVLNIARHEVPRTIYAWSLLFLHRLGVVVGMTTLIAMFVTKFGINWLPFMILAQAVLTVAGMLAFSFLNEHFSSKKLIPTYAFIAGLFLFVSTFFLEQPYVFFGLLLCVTGLFLPQLTIFISNYIEDFFTPLECERTFPVLESAQTIGGISAGLLLMTLSSYIGSYKFFYLWILFLFLLVTVIFFLEPFSSQHEHIFRHQEKTKRTFRNQVRKIRKNIRQIKLVPFLQGMLVIFMLHWIVAHILEFQYTKLIDESVGSSEGVSHEENLAHGLGSFHTLFYASALFLQLLVASRILRKIGTAGSFLLHGLVTFFSSLSLMFGFGYFTVILAKNNFELSGIVHKNAYEASYYALPHGTQRNVREFFEAFVYPVGTIIGTIFVLFVQFFFLPEHAFLALQIMLVALTVGMIVFAFRLQHSYTRLSKENLLKPGNNTAKFHAIEILSQKGHHHHLPVLIHTLKNPHETGAVKVKILEILQRINDPKTIPVIIGFLKSDDENLINAAVHALGGFSKLGEDVFEQGFSRYRIIHELKMLFTVTPSEKIRENVIRTLAVLRYEKIVPFLLDVLNGSSEKLHVACIQVCALFRDPSLADYLLPGLKSHSPHVKAETILALWQFPVYRKRLRSVLQELFHSSKREDFLAYCSVIGDIGSKKDCDGLLSRFGVLDPVLKITIAYALFKLGYEDAVQDLVHLLFSRNSLVLEKSKELFHTLRPDQKRFLQNIVQREISQRLQPLFASSSQVVSDSLSQEFLPENIAERCKEAYASVELDHEAERINAILKETIQPVYAY